MKQSMGMTVTLGIIIIFIVLLFAFLSATLSYYKTYKVNNRIIASIEKYEGVNELSIDEISSTLSSIGYQQVSINCPLEYSYKGATWWLIRSGGSYMEYILEKNNRVNSDAVSGERGYCVYALYYTNDGYIAYDISRADHVQYGVLTKMNIDLPMFNRFFRFDVFSTSRKLYDFGKGFGDR